MNIHLVVPLWSSDCFSCLTSFRACLHDALNRSSLVSHPNLFALINHSWKWLYKSKFRLFRRYFALTDIFSPPVGLVEALIRPGYLCAVFNPGDALSCCDFIRFRKGPFAAAGS